MTPQQEARYLVFGSDNFAGNPVTLCELECLEDDVSLSGIAAASATEDNVYYLRDSERIVLTRFFSRSGELLLCGHGLLALGEHLLQQPNCSSLTVLTPGGSYTLQKQDGRIWAGLPALEAIPILDPRYAITRELQDHNIRCRQIYACPNNVWIALMNSVSELQTVDPLSVATVAGRRPELGALILAVQLAENDYAFRYFAPRYGKPEDSGTGSAHCYLGPLFLTQPGAACRALQYSPRGRAEMLVQREAGGIRISGAVAADTRQQTC